MSGRRQAQPPLTPRARVQRMEIVDEEDEGIRRPVIELLDMDVDDEDDEVEEAQPPVTLNPRLNVDVDDEQDEVEEPELPVTLNPTPWPCPLKLESFLHVDQFHQFEGTLVGAFQAVVKREYATAPWLIKQLPNHNYRPTFLIINCEDILEQRGFPNGFKARSHRTFETFQYFLQVFGGNVTRLPNVKTREAIPLLYPSRDFNLNEEVVQAWQKGERKSRRICRDIYNGEKFITKILQTGKMVDLGEFVIGQSFYQEYDVNEIVHGTCSWDQLLTKIMP